MQALKTTAVGRWKKRRWQRAEYYLTMIPKQKRYPVKNQRAGRGLALLQNRWVATEHLLDGGSRLLVVEDQPSFCCRFSEPGRLLVAATLQLTSRLRSAQSLRARCACDRSKLKAREQVDEGLPREVGGSASRLTDLGRECWPCAVPRLRHCRATAR